MRQAYQMTETPSKRLVPIVRQVSLHQLPATPQTVHWGYFDNGLEPTLTVASGDLVQIEAITHQAGDAPDLLMDEGICTIYAEVSDRGPGPHVLTGPIAVEGAQPGDTLEVKILSLEPRLPFGTNIAAHWGLLYPDFGKERVTVYGFDLAAGLARAEFAYDWSTTALANLAGTIVEPGTIEREPALAGAPAASRQVAMAATLTTGASGSGRSCTIPFSYPVLC
jgi:hypothetical protein